MITETFVYASDYNDSIIYKFPSDIPRKEIWAYFDSFEDAKAELVRYFDMLISDFKNNPKQIKKLKSISQKK